MRRAMVTTVVFGVLVFLGYLLLSGSSAGVSLVKALVAAAVFGLFQIWMVRRRAAGPEGE